MSSIDYRTIIDDTLPKLAAQLGRLITPVGEGNPYYYYVKHHGHYGKHPKPYGVTCQSSWRQSADFSRPFHRTVNKTDGKYEYQYNPMRKPGTKPGGNMPFTFDDDVCNECPIVFRNLRVVRVLDQHYGPLDTVPTGPPVTTTKRYPNDSEVPVTKELERSETSWTEWGKSWELAVETEFSQTIKAGSELYGVESETSLKIAAGFATGGEKSGGKEKSESDKSGTTIKPFNTLEVLHTEQPIKASQDIIVTGQLEVEIYWGLSYCFDETSSTLEKFKDVFRGLGADNANLRSWFSDPAHCVSEADLEKITTPIVTINIGIADVPANQVEITTRQRPIPGHEG